MWILHTSDLLIGPTHRATALDKLAEWAKEEAKGRVDFVVVSGNLTEDGSSKSFDAAFLELKKFCSLVTHQDYGNNGLPRVIVAPGPSDCSASKGTLDFSNYDAFARRLYPEELQSGVHVAKEGTSFRQLKALTAISVPYWAPRNSGSKQHRLNSLKRLRRELDSVDFPDFRYGRYTPTLLVSAEFPPAAVGPLELEQLEQIRERCSKRTAMSPGLEVELHLFGAGPATALLPEAFGLGHLALGTGRKSAGWPFRANLVEIRPTASSNGVDNVYMRNHVYQQARETDSGDKRSHISGQLDLFFRKTSDPGTDAQLYKQFFEQVSQSRTNCVVVYGLPGVGKREFLSQAGVVARWGDSPAKILRVQNLMTYSKDSLQNVMAQVRAARESLTPEQKVVVLLREDATNQTPQHVTARECFIDTAYDLAEKHNAVFVILCGFADFRAPPDVELCSLPPLSHTEVEALVEAYGCANPFGTDDVVRYLNSLTGGYGSFTRLFLDSARSAFNKRLGTAPITATTSIQLLKEALQDSSIRRESRWSLQQIEAMHKGAEVCSYIRRNVQAASGHDSTQHLSQVFLEPENVIPGASEHELTAVRGVFAQLVKLHVVAPDKGTGRYPLMLVAPFLFGPVQPSRPLADSANGANGGGIPPTADFLLVAPMDEECEPLIEMLGARAVPMRPRDVTQYYQAWLEFVTPSGDRGRYSVAIGVVGKGRSRAAVATALALDRWRPKHVLLVGIAGGLAKADVQIGDILIAQSIVDGGQKVQAAQVQVRWAHYEVEPTLLRAAQALKLDSATRRQHLFQGNSVPKKRVGVIFSDDDVVLLDEITAKLMQQHPQAIGVEMEAGGVAEAARNHPSRPDFFMVRAVSDLADSNKYTKDVEGRRAVVCARAAAFAISLLETGPVVYAQDPVVPVQAM